MKIYIPNSAFIGNIDSFIKGFDPSNPNKLTIGANPKWMSVHPVALAMIAALGLKVKADHISCEKFEASSKNYFERMGLFKMLGIKSGISITEHESSGRFIPLTQIKNSTELTHFLTDMVPLLHVEPIHAESIRYVVSELVRNVLEHAAASDGAILAAQYYKKSNTIRIGIVDTGIGVKKSITMSHPARTDGEAIRLALTPGITGSTSREGGNEINAGAGLFFIKSIAAVNRQPFILYSGNAMYKLHKTPPNKRVHLKADPYEDNYSAREDLPYWQGTVVGVDISLESTEEFTNLLDLIGNIYSTAIKERKEKRYKKPRFI